MIIASSHFLQQLCPWPMIPCWKSLPYYWSVIWALSNNRSISIQFLCTHYRGLYSCSGQLAFITGTFICSTVVNFTEVKVWVWANVVLGVWWLFCVWPFENGSGVSSRFIYFLPCVEIVRSWNWRLTFWNCASQLTLIQSEYEPICFYVQCFVSASLAWFCHRLGKNATTHIKSCPVY